MLAKYAISFPFLQPIRKVKVFRGKSLKCMTLTEWEARRDEISTRTSR